MKRKSTLALAVTAILSVSALAIAVPASANAINDSFAVAAATSNAYGTQAEQAQYLFENINAYRVDNGLKPLVRNTAIDTVAQSWTDYSVSEGKFGHNVSYAAQIPVGYASNGEIVANAPSVESILTGWQFSELHNDNLLDPNFTDFGIGVAKQDQKPAGEGFGNFYSTIVFAQYDAVAPTEDPTVNPDPTDEPTVTPTDEPTVTPTDEPTVTPTDEPTVTPTDEPTADPVDTLDPNATDPAGNPEPTDWGQPPVTDPTADPVDTLDPNATDPAGNPEPTDWGQPPVTDPTDDAVLAPTDNPVDTLDPNATDPAGNPEPANGNKVDANGNRVDADGNILNADGTKKDELAQTGSSTLPLGLGALALLGGGGALMFGSRRKEAKH